MSTDSNPTESKTATNWESKFRDAHVLLRARDEEVATLRAALEDLAAMKGFSEIMRLHAEAALKAHKGE